MQNEIERKFFVKELPDLSGISPLHYERYILKNEDGEEERISKIDDRYFYERKAAISNLERSREKKEISEEEFNSLKEQAVGSLTRERYDLSENPKVSIQIYHGRYKGLKRAEVEFQTEEEAVTFRPPAWMGEEMTDLPIARDARLLELEEDEFRSYLK